MLAGIETMLRHADLLQGAQFQWLTQADHKGLTHLLNQKNLSGRQARWLGKISSFSFTVVYIEGGENTLADALSRIYLNDSVGTQRARSEYTYHNVVDDDTSDIVTIDDTLPVLAGIDARIASRRSTCMRRPTEKVLLGQADESSESDGRPARPPCRSVLRAKPEGGQEEYKTY